MAEIDENFVRAGLSHRELGDLLLRRKELYEAIHPETRQGQRNGQTAKNDNLTVLEAKPFAEDTAEKLGVSKRAVEQLVQTARDLTPEAKKIIQETDTRIAKGAALKISRLPPDQQAEAAAILTIAPPTKEKPDTADLESLLKEFKAHAPHFISGLTAFDQQADTFVRMSYVQSNEL